MISATKFFAFVSLVAISTSVCQSATIGGKSDGRHPDLAYKTQLATGISNRIFQPETSNGGAVLFLPSCSGVQHFNSTDIRNNWVNLLLENGYTVAVTDYNEGRNASRPWNCGKKKHLSHSRLVRDVYNGVQALAEISGIDKDKVFTVGTSLGAQIGASALDARYVKQAEKVGWVVARAHVGLYGGCSYPSQTYLSKSITRPVLWMSASDDVEVGEGCNSWLFNSIRKKYPESEFVMYDGATHCWDCRQLNGYSKKTYYGVQMYRFDEEITTDSQNAVVTFLEKFISGSVAPPTKASETTNSNKKASSGSDR